MAKSKDYYAYQKAGMETEYNSIGNLNLFMQCDLINEAAFKPLPTGYSFRLCRRNELEIWKRLLVEEEYIHYVSDYYSKVYVPHEEEFFQTLLVCL